MIPYFNLSDAMARNDYRRALTFVLLLFAVVLLAGIGLRSPWPADEPRFVEIAHEMVTSGHWFFPHRAGELYPDKPPVFMWAIAACYALIGHLQVAFMLPNILVSLISLWCVFDLAAKLWNVRVATFASIGLLIAPQFILQAKTAQIDAMVAAWVTISMTLLMRHFFIRPQWRLYYLAWAFMGLGIITKGVGFLPIFVFMPILLLYVSRQYDFAGAIHWRLLFGPLILVGVVACWLGPMIWFSHHSGNPDYIAYQHDILFKQTMQRYAHSWTHVQPWYYFLLAFPFFWFPLPLLLLSPSFWRKICDVRVFTLLCWVAIVLLFFSATPGKRHVYMLPALPMLAIAVAPYLSAYHFPSPLALISRLLIGLLGVTLSLGGCLLLLHVPSVVQFAAKKTVGMSILSPLITGFGWFFLLGGLGALMILIAMHRRQALSLLAVTSVYGWLIFSWIGYPLINPLRTAAIPIMHQAAEKVGVHGQLGVVDFKEQFLLASPINLTQFSYLASRREQFRNAWLWMNEAPHRFILFPTDAHPPQLACFQMAKAHQLGEGYRRTWWLLGRDGLKSTCTPPKQVKRYHLIKASPHHLNSIH